MKSIESNKQFNDLIASGKPYVIDFYADWCGPCQAMMPTIKKLASDYKEEVEIVKVNIDKQQDIAKKFQIRSIPTLFFGKADKIKERMNGATSEHVLRKKIDKLLN